ncbi:MAG: hypothetical protein C0468_07745, partial [Planctomyces sp.]|nr:hypothetical protein [Planctomyces sp.]
MWPGPVGGAEAGAWLRAAARAEVAQGIDAVYQMVADQVEARGPACWASGRCCDFGRSGHALYVTGLEAALAALRWVPGRGAGGVAGGSAAGPGPMVALGSAVELAAQRGRCAFQEGNLCGARAVRPLGCRVYFCDRGAQGWQRDLSERAMAMIRGVHDRHGVAYRYGEWNALLGAVVAQRGAELVIR